MKVNIDKTLEVSDEQRKQIAQHLDGEGAKKRDATRDEMKEFIWNNGASWAQVLDGSLLPVITEDADNSEVLTGSGAEFLGNVDITHEGPTAEDLDLI